MKSRGPEHKQRIITDDAITLWSWLGCQPRGHEVVGVESFTLVEFLDTTNNIVERSRRRDGDFYEKIYRMIDFHGKHEVSLDDLKLFCRMCNVDVGEDVLKSLIHTVEKSGDDTFIGRDDYLEWFEHELYKSDQEKLL